MKKTLTVLLIEDSADYAALVQQWLSIKLFRDDVSNLPRTCELENNCIHKRNVIGQQEETTFGQMFAPKSSNAIHCPANCQSQEINGPLEC